MLENALEANKDQLDKRINDISVLINRYKERDISFVQDDNYYQDPYDIRPTKPSIDLSFLNRYIFPALYTHKNLDKIMSHLSQYITKRILNEYQIVCLIKHIVSSSLVYDDIIYTKATWENLEDYRDLIFINNLDPELIFLRQKACCVGFSKLCVYFLNGLGIMSSMVGYNGHAFVKVSIYGKNYYIEPQADDGIFYIA